jgi:outer membrane protein assembly factor BamD
MALSRTNPKAGLVGIALVLACASSFKLSRYPSNESLFGAGMREYRAKHWDNAVQAFEKLTLDLPVRDTLLPLSHFYLAGAHAARGDHLLAAQEYSRLAESFATDTLADDAQFAAAREYQQLWRRPELDATYGGEAVAAYQLLLGLYPDSPLRDSAMKQLARLDEWYAVKDYQTGMHYFRRKAFDSAIIYFRGVVDKFPQTAKVHDAYLRLAEVYERIRWKEDKAEVCATLREKYPSDREVTTICGAAVTSRMAPAKPDTL